ncbi:MAG: FprA family A-type flavoprotein [Acidobacteriota bacterium]
MSVKKIKKNVWSVGAIDWERRMFDEIVPLPDGTSYNSYLIQGSKKTALIDTVEPHFYGDLLDNLKDINVKKIDYIISNHAEQDHSGAIPQVLKQYPEAKVVTNEKCKKMLIDLLPIDEDKFIVVKDKEILSLGDKTLEFILAPWVHWPETMFTYLKEDDILFTCDFLGSHLATSDLYADFDDFKIYEDAKLYYVEIMMPYKTFFKKSLDLVEDMNPSVIAPSHGPVYDKPEYIINLHKKWVSDKVENQVLLFWVSMHGSTREMVDYLEKALIKRKVGVKKFNLVSSDASRLTMSLVDAATIVLATPAVLGGAHPAAVYAAYLTGILKPKIKFASIIGSFSWGSRLVDQLKGLMPQRGVDFIDPVLAKGAPKDEVWKDLDRLADDILEKHKSEGLL